MIINLQQALAYAQKHRCAVGAFNTPNLECIQAVIGAAETKKLPIIISHAEMHESVAPLATIGPVMRMMAEKADVPVCVHLDHCEHLEYLRRALDIGFTGVMYDGSTLPYAENAANTRMAVGMAQKYGAGVEAEIGTLASREGGAAGDAAGPVYTDPALAKKFVEETGINALAPSFGTSHGIYKAKPKLDLELVDRIYQTVGLPLVMHGGSGVSPEDYVTAIQNGIRKVNYYSYMSREGVFAVQRMLKTQDVTFYHDLAAAATAAMQADAERAMNLLYGMDPQTGRN